MLFCVHQPWDGSVPPRRLSHRRSAQITRPRESVWKPSAGASLASPARSGRPGATQRQQSISDEDFVAGAIELGQRLTRHLTALENGEAGAVADVAAVVRTLIVRGEGDDVIRRLCRRKHVPIPEVLVTRAAHDGPSVVLSAGAIPVTPEDQDNPHQIATRMVDLNVWSDMTALVVRGGTPRRVNNWDRVISMYPHTFGSHMSGTIPNTLLGWAWAMRSSASDRPV